MGIQAAENESGKFCVLINYLSGSMDFFKMTAKSTFFNYKGMKITPLSRTMRYKIRNRYENEKGKL